MKQFFVPIMILIINSYSLASDTIYPKDAINYLEKMDCDFSAFATYTGPDASSMLGSLKKGQAFSSAVCAASYSEGGAKKHNFCWLRPLDLKLGVYKDKGRSSKGDVWRDESGACSKESVIKLFNKNRILSEMLYGGNKEWKTVVDKTGAIPDISVFLEEIKKKQRSATNERIKKLKNGKYRWWYYTPTSSCNDSPGQADEFLEPGLANPSTVVKRTDEILILKMGDNVNQFYVSKELCESSNKSFNKKNKK